LLETTTPGEIGIWNSCIPRKLVSIRRKPLSYISPITASTALSIDMFSPAYQRCARSRIIAVPSKHSNVSDEYSIPRQMHSPIQREVQTRAGKSCMNSIWESYRVPDITSCYVITSKGAIKQFSYVLDVTKSTNNGCTQQYCSLIIFMRALFSAGKQVQDFWKSQEELVAYK
jgi:hypothetical protein